MEWARNLDRVTVFATYASLGLGTLRAAQAGLARTIGAPLTRSAQTSATSTITVRDPIFTSQERNEFACSLPNGDCWAVR